MRIEYPDIFFMPEYQELFKDTAFGGEPQTFEAAGIEYRYYKRPIPDTPYYDIVSPYGYSGPIEMGQASTSCRALFLGQFADYCRQKNIVSEFARLHPFLDNVLSGPNHYEREIYYIDLTQTEDEIWKGFDKGCRSAIKGQTEKTHPMNFGQFATRYCKHMLSINAPTEYLFTERFWTLLFAAYFFQTETAAACFLLHKPYCHYFLSAGTNANNLIWESIKWAKSQGCKIFNLGGGLQAGDSLESFKKSFTKTSKPFYTYRKIHNQEAYNEVCKAKGVEPTTDGFFPAYRRVK